MMSLTFGHLAPEAMLQLHSHTTRRERIVTNLKDAQQGTRQYSILSYAAKSSNTHELFTLILQGIVKTESNLLEKSCCKW
jgi:hypothetical protein